MSGRSIDACPSDAAPAAALPAAHASAYAAVAQPPRAENLLQCIAPLAKALQDTTARAASSSSINFSSTAAAHMELTSALTDVETARAVQLLHHQTCVAIREGWGTGAAGGSSSGGRAASQPADVASLMDQSVHLSTDTMQSLARLSGALSASQKLLAAKLSAASTIALETLRLQLVLSIPGGGSSAGAEPPCDGLNARVLEQLRQHADLSGQIDEQFAGLRDELSAADKAAASDLGLVSELGEASGVAGQPAPQSKSPSSVGAGEGGGVAAGAGPGAGKAQAAEPVKLESPPTQEDPGGDGRSSEYPVVVPDTPP